MAFHVPDKFRVLMGPLASTVADGNNGCFLFIDERQRQFNKQHSVLRAIASDGDGWEHVSVSWPHRTPTWEEMCEVKALFWDKEDCVVQYHPPESDYVNCHPFTLHLWRQVGAEFPRPPTYMVGPQ
jgi:hypothetical protein